MSKITCDGDELVQVLDILRSALGLYNNNKVYRNHFLVTINSVNHVTCLIAAALNWMSIGQGTSNGFYFHVTPLGRRALGIDSMTGTTI